MMRLHQPDQFFAIAQRRVKGLIGTLAIAVALMPIVPTLQQQGSVLSIQMPISAAIAGPKSEMASLKNRTNAGLKLIYPLKG
jgi:hypothetical protein